MGCWTVVDCDGTLEAQQLMILSWKQLYTAKYFESREKFLTLFKHCLNNATEPTKVVFNVTDTTSKLRIVTINTNNVKVIIRLIIYRRRPQGGQHMTWQRNMKSLTEGLSRVGNVMLAGWGPRDPSQLRLATLSDMASSRSQWRSRTFSLAPSFWRYLDYLSIFKFLPLISDVTSVISFYVACMVTRTNVSHSVHGCETELN